MRKLKFLLAFAALLLSACSDDGGSPAYNFEVAGIEGIPVAEEIDEVWLQMYISSTSSFVTLAKGPFVDNGFKINMPATVNGAYLISAQDKWSADVAPNIKVTAGEIYFVPASGGTAYEGTFFERAKYPAGYAYRTFFVYSAEPFSLSGVMPGNSTYEAELGRGWNEITEEVTLEPAVSRRFTNTIPSGMVWYYTRP